MTEAKVKRKSHSDMHPRNCPRRLMAATLVPVFAYLNPTLPRCVSTKKAKQGHVSRIKHNATVRRITKSIEKL